MATSCGRFESLIRNTTLIQDVRVMKDSTGRYDKTLEIGSRTCVIEIEYLGLKCAGKKINDHLRENHSTIRRFEEECRLLSHLRHPNIVQFLGVYFQQGMPAPMLVMELPSPHLTSCIRKYGILPKEIGYSILHDVALGLHYLHSQNPPILHRDLSTDNVLLTPNMTAKIAHLSAARVLEHQQDDEHIMYPPGRSSFMPPEVLAHCEHFANSLAMKMYKQHHPPSMKYRYDTFIDEFSYGVLMIHVFSGKEPGWGRIPALRFERDGTATLLSEAQQREELLRAIRNDHPLMDLILKCIKDDPQARPQVTEILERLVEMVLQFPASIVDRLEILAEMDISLLPESDQLRLIPR